MSHLLVNVVQHGCTTRSLRTPGIQAETSTRVAFIMRAPPTHVIPRAIASQ